MLFWRGGADFGDLLPQIAERAGRTSRGTTARPARACFHAMSGPVVKGMVDLAVEASQSSVLNASNPEALAKVLAEGAEPILSDTDEQLLIGA